MVYGSGKWVQRLNWAIWETQTVDFANSNLVVALSIGGKNSQY